MTTLESNTTTSSNAVEQLVTSLENVSVHDVASQTELFPMPEKTTSPNPPMRIYTRPQILFLSNSPLIRLPPGMPDLKEWFGVENEQNLAKKELETTTTGSARERRFRRDIEDGEMPSRSTFRSTLSQPSQMGNFKHQSLRGSDREREKDRERDADKDRERDIRDKDGHERLRHLSDKYDRDRLALPLSSRIKERDPAPHLSAGPSSRTVGQSHLVPGSRRDTRDITKKKVGETSEDWRKGSDARFTREERTDITRRDREELGKSRVRDSSKSRREVSPSRRDREREPDREPDDDPRRWRDDGKRDERLARRLRDKDTVLDPADRRWVAGEEREGRTKRPSGRDRKPIDEVRDRDDRRDREREKEKEPAWMDTYVPSKTGGGILGGKAGDGELDGIQAWKKERKEKEMKDKVDMNPAKGTTSSTQESVQNLDGNGASLDEIQIFRLLMKREEEKKKVDTTDDVSQTGVEHSMETTAVAKNPPLSSNPSTTHHQIFDESNPSNGTAPASSTQRSPPPEARSETSAPTLLSFLSTMDVSPLPGTQIPSDISRSSLNLSHTTNTPPIQEFAHQTHQNADISRDAMPQFNPPPGSRLLAFARTAPKSQNNLSSAVINDPPPSTSPNSGLQQAEFSLPISSKSDNLRPLPGFSPFEDHSHSHGLEDFNNLAVSPDANRRPTTERPAFTPPIEQAQFLDSTSLENGNGYSVNKGSRFAKFFDAKGREGLPILSKTPAGLVSSSPGPGSQKLEHGYNTNQGNGPDPRAMDEIYAMLSSSAQVRKFSLWRMIGV
ncbi:hypothetical protein H2248_000680 [Termitomyces sp. 'cryptogamus']|nr:hypothetical protein H2248_000680 [Termitomyces sp. 'cryptogamus']